MALSPKNSIITRIAPVLQATKFQEFETNTSVICPTPNFSSSDFWVCPEKITLCDHSNKTPLAGLLHIILSFFCILFISMIWNLSCFLLFFSKLWHSVLQGVTCSKAGNALKFYFCMTCMCVFKSKESPKILFWGDVPQYNSVLHCAIFMCNKLWWLCEHLWQLAKWKFEDRFLSL